MANETLREALDYIKRDSFRFNINWDEEQVKNIICAYEEYKTNKGIPYRPVRASETDDKNNELSIKVNFDCEDALKGLKALQREIKETTRGFKEMTTYTS